MNFEDTSFPERSAPMSAPLEEGHSRPPRSLSRLLLDLMKQNREEVSIGDLAHCLRDRSFGAFLLVFSIPCLLPFPPFTTLILGMPLVLIMWQKIRGRNEIKLPGFLTNRSVTGERFDELVRKGLPTLRLIEKAVRPRSWTMMNNPAVDRALSFYMFFISILVVLPIPLGNWLPALAIALFGAALSQRDGVWLKRSLALSVLSLIVAAAVVIFGWQFVAFAWSSLLGLFG